MRVLRCGWDAALVEVAGRDEVLALHAALRAARPDGVRELVPAARTLLVRYDPSRLDHPGLAALLADLPPADVPTGGRAGELVVPVRYGGADLAEVAALTGLDPSEVVRRHLAGRYTAAFCGFAPGFAYLTGLDERLRVPRRAEPRTRVPAGSVALADEYTAVYPGPSPGGWRLIGRTELTVWDLDRDPVTLLPPGTVVRFADAARC